jgi:hypothetical protein
MLFHNLDCRFMFDWFFSVLAAEPGRGVRKHGSCIGRSGGGGAATNNSIFIISKFLTLWNIFM